MSWGVSFSVACATGFIRHSNEASRMNDRHYHYQHAASSSSTASFSSTVSLASSGCHYYRDDHVPDAKPQAVTPSPLLPRSR